MLGAILSVLLAGVQSVAWALLALGRGLVAVLLAFPAAVVFGTLALLFGYTLVTTPPFSYFLSHRLIILILLLGLGLGLWLDWRRR